MEILNILVKLLFIIYIAIVICDLYIFPLVKHFKGNNDRDYVNNPCKYLDYVLINEDWDKDWKCMRGYGLCPRCDICKDYERGDKNNES